MRIFDSSTAIEFIDFWQDHSTKKKKIIKKKAHDVKCSDTRAMKILHLKKISA